MIQDHASTIFTGNHIFVVVIEAENEMIHPFQAEKVAKVNGFALKWYTRVQ